MFGELNNLINKCNKGPYQNKHTLVVCGLFTHLLRPNHDGPDTQTSSQQLCVATIMKVCILIGFSNGYDLV